MWGITKVIDEDDWFEGYVRIALSSQPAALPAKRQKLGSTTMQWHECEPGVAFIDTRGGTPDDRAFATQYMKAMLAGHGYRVAQFEIDYEGLDDPISKTAKWGDIMAKAKRLIQTGNVTLLRNGAQNIVGQVVGDHGTYQTEISREDPNSQAITQWQCECPWDQYAWQRTRQWKKYEGRPCAHVLATFWKSQATPIDEDAHPAVTQVPPGQAPPPMVPGRSFMPDPMESQGNPMAQPNPMGPVPGAPVPGMMPGPGQAMGTPPLPGAPPEVLPPFPMEGQLEPQQPQVSIPGAKPQTPLNPMQWPGGTLSSSGWDMQVFGTVKESEAGWQNGAMVQLVGTDMGIAEGPDPSNPMHGNYMDIRSNAKGLGEVMGSDELPGLGPMVEVIFPLDKTGPLQPYHIRAWLRPEQLLLRPDIRRPGPFIKRRREIR